MRPSLRNCFFAVVFLLTSPSLSFAATSQEVFFPVSNITLSYDTKTSMLHVQAAHPSQNWEIDYVNTMTVSVNGNVITSHNYLHQSGSGSQFSDDVSVKAQAGDVISVELDTSHGMSATEQMTVGQDSGNQEAGSTSS